MATSPTNPIKLKEEEIKICRDAVKFFFDKPWKDKYLGVSQRDWLIFLQSHFPDPLGNWYDLSDPDFLGKIAQRIEDHLNLLATLSPGATIPDTLPSIPPNLKQLVEEYETARSKKAREEKATNLSKLLWHNWELARNRALLKNDLQPNLKEVIQPHTAKVFNRIIDSYQVKIPNLQKANQDPHLVQKVIKQTLEALSDDDQIAIINDTDPQSPQTKSLFKKVTQELLQQSQPDPQLAKDTAAAAEKEFARSTTDIGDLKSTFQEQTRYQILVDFQEKRIQDLEAAAAHPSTATPSTPYLPSEPELANFINQALEEFNQDFRRIGVSPGNLNLIADDIFNDILNKTIRSQNWLLWTLPEKKATADLIKIIANSFAQNLKRLEITGVFSAIKNTFLPSKRFQAIEKITDQIESNLQKPPPQFQPSLISSLKIGTVRNIGYADQSIEAGHPLGRLPEIIKLMILRTERDKLLKRSTDQLTAEFQQFLFDRYEAGQDLTESQKASIGALYDLMKSLEKYAPGVAKMLRRYSKHHTLSMAARGALSFFLKQPDYILHLPWLFGKMYLIEGVLKQELWEMTLKPRFISSLSQVPGLGGIFRFWYGQRNQWGLFTPLPERLKKKFLEKTFRGVVKLTGKGLTWLGQKLGLQKLTQTGTKLLKGLLVGGGIGSIISLTVAFWPQIKSALKRMGQALLLWFIGLYSWAAQYGTGVLVGAGLGSAAGAAGSVAAAIKVGTGVALATGGNVILGALAGLGTWIVGNLVLIPLGGILGGGLGYLFTKAWLGIKSALSSIFGAGAEMATTGVGAGVGISIDTAIAGKILVVSGGLITGLYFYTQLVNTSSLLPPEGLEFLAGSKYIEIEKGVQVGEESDKNQFENRYSLPNDICDPPAKNVYYKIELEVSKTLTDIKITDKTTRTGEYGSVTVQEKSWEIDDLEKGETWKSEVYSFTLTPDFKDSYLSNTVTVTTAEGEEKTATLTLKIGNPPAPPLKDAVELLIDTLISCYQTHQINQATLTDSGQCLLKKQIPQSAVDAILKSIGGYTNLQCVGLVIAATQMAGQPLESHHAIDYYGKDFGNYHWHSNFEMDNIREGDIFVSAKSPGHLAVVYEVNLNGFRLAEAFGNSCAQEGPYATLCAGYVRYQNGTFITFNQAKDRGEIGFLRYGE